MLARGLDDVHNSVDVGPFRDAHLGPYAARCDGDLVAAARLAERLGWACRVVNVHVPGDEEHSLTSLRILLDGRP